MQTVGAGNIQVVMQRKDKPKHRSKGGDGLHCKVRIQLWDAWQSHEPIMGSMAKS